MKAENHIQLCTGQRNRSLYSIAEKVPILKFIPFPSVFFLSSTTSPPWVSGPVLMFDTHLVPPWCPARVLQLNSNLEHSLFGSPAGGVLPLFILLLLFSFVQVTLTQGL